MPIMSSRVSPVLVERDRELSELGRLIGEARSGQLRIALLIGEAGAGKSRLLREIVPRAVESGFHLLAGGCVERDRTYPFAPVVDAIRQRLAEMPSDHGRFLGPQVEALSELLPELRQSRERDVVRPALTPEHAKRCLFESISGVFSRLAAQQPLLVILEDLHWADPTSLELLELLPRRLAGDRVVILGTARSDEVNEDLDKCLSTLRRARASVEFSIDPLSLDGVGQMLSSFLSNPPSPALTRSVYARTDGNPFFIEELIASGAVRVGAEWLLSEPAVPATVRDAVLRRLEGLPPEALTTADLAAVCGQRFTFELLQSASTLPIDKLFAALQLLKDRQLLIDEPSPGHARLAFRHALMRDALLARIVMPKRRALHRAVGEALMRTAAPWTPEEATGELGYHFSMARDWSRTLTYAVRAGDAAHHLHATFEALAHDQRALEAAVALDDPLTAELYRRCGQGLALIGALGAARAHLETARSEARQRELADVEQAATYDLAGLLASNDYAAACRLAEEALRLARSLDDRQREGLALNRLGNMLTNRRRFDEGRSLHEEARALFESAGDKWGGADSWDLIGMARYLAGHVPEAREAFGRAADVFAELEDAERLASALTSRGLYLAVLDGPCATDVGPAAFRADASAGLRLCHQIGWRSGEAYAHVALSCASTGDGQYGEAQTHGEHALAIAEEIGHSQWTVISLLTLGILDVELLDVDAASARFERARDIAHAGSAEQWVERLDAWIAFCRVRDNPGDPAVTALASRSADGSPSSIGQRRALFALVERELATGRPVRALELADRLVSGAAGPRAASVVLRRSDVLMALGRTEEADAGYRDARRLAVKVGPRSVVWRSAAALTRLWRDHDPAVADEEAALARSEVAALAMSLSDETRRGAFLRAPELRQWVRPSGRRRTAVAPAPGGLTPREREVAACVGRGLSNKEIARTLVIAEKTVEMHASSCFGKLGLTSRAQLAVWAVVEGLSPAPQSLR